MKNQTGVVILVLVCLGLGIALITVKVQSSRQHETDNKQLVSFSNDLATASSASNEQAQVTATLYKERDDQKQAFQDLTNNYTKISGDLAQTSSDLAKTQQSMKEEVAKRDTRITELEEKNAALDKESLELGTSITNLTAQITETQRKLSASEGDKAFLEKELKRLMGEKAELERQFNDVTVLKAQVARLKEQMAVARRLQWTRDGVYARAEQKGAQQLLQNGTFAQVAQARTMRPAYDLNVEVGADGSVKVVPPPTNSPAGLNP